MEGILILILLTFAYWLTAVILLLVGFSKLSSKPDQAKKFLIASTIMLLVGFGFCGIVLN